MTLSKYCSPDNSELLLRLPPQPISNRFRKESSEPETLFPLALSQCNGTGLLFLSQSAPQCELVPRISWLTYNEPEAHLDQMVEELYNHCKLTPSSVIGGISSKDDSTLERFQKRGCRCWRLQLNEDLGIAQPGVGVESIQRELSTESAAKAIDRHGKANLLIVRHIFEHVYDIPRFLRALSELTQEGGSIVLEVPDCSRALARCDYTTLWEEHLFYFTETTLKALLQLEGYPLTYFKTYPYPFENSLVAVIQNKRAPQTLSVEDASLKKEQAIAREFAKQFPSTQQELTRIFERYSAKGKVAVFGAGHLTSTFLALFDLARFCSFVIDDNPNKAGLLLPGTNLPIHTSTSLESTPVSLCLVGLNPMNEDKVIEKFSPLVEARGGEFRSIFPVSRRYILGKS